MQSTNPEVDFLIGRELSQKYRFREGAGYQEQSLRLDPDYLPAKSQLAQDRLRLGQEEQGWELAQRGDLGLRRIAGQSCLGTDDDARLSSNDLRRRIDARQQVAYRRSIRRT